MSTEENKTPPGGGQGGARKGQSRGSEDGGKNKPNGGNSQDGFDFAAFENLGSRPNRGAAPISRVVASWVYTDERGAPLYKVDRLEDGTLGPNGKPKKTFRQSKADHFPALIARTPVLSNRLGSLISYASRAIAVTTPYSLQMCRGPGSKQSRD